MARGPISRREIKRARELKAAGFKAWAIARELGRSIEAVQMMLARDAAPGEAQSKKAQQAFLGTPAAAERCPGCGRKIYLWPCLDCSNHAARKRLRH